MLGATLLTATVSTVVLSVGILSISIGRAVDDFWLRGMLAGSLAEYLAVRQRNPAASHA